MYGVCHLYMYQNRILMKELFEIIKKIPIKDQKALGTNFSAPKNR